MRDGAIGVGLIGYGLGGSAFHAPLVQAEPGLRLHAVVTSRAAQVERELPGVGGGGGGGGCGGAGRGGVWVVAAPTPPPQERAAAARRGGRPVVVEKPFTLTTAAADELI